MLMSDPSLPRPLLVCRCTTTASNEVSKVAAVQAEERSTRSTSKSGLTMCKERHTNHSLLSLSMCSLIKVCSIDPMKDAAASARVNNFESACPASPDSSAGCGTIHFALQIDSSLKILPAEGHAVLRNCDSLQSIYLFVKAL